MTGLTEETTDAEAGIIFLRNHICVHTTDFEEKYNSLIVMVQKLYTVVTGFCEIDNLDSVALQDVLLSGHVYQQVLVEQISDMLQLSVKGKII